MKSLDLKLRMTVLWIWSAIGMAAALIFVVIEPEKLKIIMSEIQAWGPSWYIIGTLYGIIPLIMAFLTITLKDKANRLTQNGLEPVLAVPAFSLSTYL